MKKTSLIFLTVFLSFFFESPYASGQSSTPTGFKKYLLMSEISDYPEAKLDSKQGQSVFFSNQCPSVYGESSLSITSFHGKSLLNSDLSYLYNSFDKYFTVYRISSTQETFMSAAVKQIVFVVYKGKIVTIALSFGDLKGYIDLNNLMISEFGPPPDKYDQDLTQNRDWGFLTLHISKCSSSTSEHFTEVIITSSEAQTYLIQEGKTEKSKVQKDY